MGVGEAGQPNRGNKNTKKKTDVGVERWLAKRDNEKEEEAALSYLSILSRGLFCCYILMGFGSFSFSLIALVAPFR